MRVLVLNERDPRHPRAGGAEVQLTELAPRLAPLGIELSQLACGFPGGSRRERVDGIEVRRLGPLAAYYPRAAWRCARETRAGRHDVVLDVLAKFPFFSPLYSAVPVLGLCHHLFGRTAFRQVPWPVAAAVWCAEGLVPRVYRRAPVVAVSESTRDDLVRRGLDPARVRVIHNGTRRPRVEAPAPEPADLRVTYLGRLERYKRIEVLLHAMARLADRFPKTEIAVIGRGAERARLERLAARLGLAERTRFVGFAGDAERDALVAGSRVCVCPSEKEGWGLTVLEANALGVPVVASDAPGLRDSVRDGETGFLVPGGDVEAFAERIAALLADDALARRMSAAARAWAGRFDWERAARELAEALEAARSGS